MLSKEKQIEFPNEKIAQAAVKAVSVELDNEFEKRSKTTITSNKNVILLKIVAEDESALKASLYSYERMIMLCKKLIEIEGGKEKWVKWTKWFKSLKKAESN